MDAVVDHYRVLGLSSGEKGVKLSNKEISQAYKKKALELHPDKRPNDPNAHDNFHKLKSSYELLMDCAARQRLDELLKVRAIRHENKQRSKEFDAQRRRMVSELDEREKQWFAAKKASEEAEERTKRKFQEDIVGIRATYKKTKFSQYKEEVKKEVKKQADQTQPQPQPQPQLVDNAKVLEVSWEKCGCDYSASRLREVFGKFGKVEHVVIRNRFNKKPSALIVMASKADAISATRTLCGDLSNPLLVLPLQNQVPIINKIVGFQAYENLVLDKLRKAAHQHHSRPVS